MKSEDLKKRTKEFAHRCVKAAVLLPKSYLGNHIQSQLIKCGTSVAANYRAAYIAQTKAGFISKLSIVTEEADESCFWLEFITDEKLLNKKHTEPLLDEAKQLMAIFISSRKTAQKNKKLSINNYQ